MFLFYIGLSDYLVVLFWCYFIFVNGRCEISKIDFSFQFLIFRTGKKIRKKRSKRKNRGGHSGGFPPCPFQRWNFTSSVSTIIFSEPVKPTFSPSQIMRESLDHSQPKIQKYLYFLRLRMVKSVIKQFSPVSVFNPAHFGDVSFSIHNSNMAIPPKSIF